MMAYLLARRLDKVDGESVPRNRAKKRHDVPDGKGNEEKFEFGTDGRVVSLNLIIRA
jgi:hypothetical protein